DAIDDDAKAAYRARIAELEAEVAEADDAHDLDRASRAREELEFLVDELSASLGVGGRPRRAPDAQERARKAVTARIRYVIDRVADATRMGEWSPENEGGEWLDGATGPAAGARFRGSNKRKLSWKTIATVTESRRGAAFGFAVGKHAPERPDTTWRYTFTPSG